MRKVIVCNIVSLDGYYEGPGGNVMVMPMDDAFNAHNLERMRNAGTVLLGRKSFEGFSSYWPGIADAPPDPGNPAVDETNRELSRIYNGLPKVVVSDTYRVPADNAWAEQTTVVPRSEAADRVTELKQSGQGDILVYGSRTMWNGLLAEGVVDELHLMVGAVVLGGGTPTFTAPVAGLALLDARRFDGSDNVVLRYATSR